MVILFTPRRLSSYNATFTLSAKKNYHFSILQHEFHFDQVELDFISAKTSEVGDEEQTHLH